ncbi:guanylate kinase [Desulfovibrio aminophilus]|nr:guanylate kinase [Desulfovibrio aminophilus]MCM0756697.1 guanylate kinase [Desulfovibrio aminophilus]
MSERRGIVLVLSAPSGAGKSTLVRKLLREFPEIGYSVSYTTRAPRGAERDGTDYHFVDRDRFLAMREAGEFAEWAEVHGNFYGTAKAPVLAMLDQGRDALFDIDVQGAAQLRKAFSEAVLAFILPPSRAELERRLRGRGTDAPEVVAKRLENARAEIAAADNFDFLILNDDLDRACDELRAVYLAARLRPGLRPGLVAGLLAEWGRHG